MMTRRELLIGTGLCALGGMHAARASVRTSAALAALPIGLIDCNACVIEPPGSTSCVITRHTVLDPRQVAQIAPRRFLAVLAPASAVVLREMMRFEPAAAIVSLPRNRLDPEMIPLLTADAAVLYVALPADPPRPGAP